jgi:uncharacterized membrane protein
MKKTFTPRDMAICAMIAALYTALCLALAPLSYGAVQVRVAEALALLPVFSPLCVWGVTLGCAVANLVGFITGTNILGAFDIVFGTLATLIAGILSYRLRNIRVKGLPVASAVPPVLVNALVIGLELTYMLVGTFDMGVFAVNALQVGLGQLAACFVLGLPLCYMLEKTGLARKFLEIRK